LINWRYFPKSAAPPQLALDVVRVLQEAPDLDSSIREIPRSQVLAAIEPGLQGLGFSIDTDAHRSQNFSLSVLFRQNGRADKPYRPSAYHAQSGFVVEVEAGRVASGNQFLRDLLNVCLMEDVFYFALAVRNLNRNSRDFEAICGFLDMLYASDRIRLPLRGILIIGY